MKNNERIRVAKKILSACLQIKPQEKVLLILDKDSNNGLIAIIEKALLDKKSFVEKFFLNETKTQDKLHKKLGSFKTIIDLSFLMDTHKATLKLYKNDLHRYQCRLISLSDLTPDSFNAGGALSESITALNKRMAVMEAMLSRAKGFHIKTNLGTNLWVKIKPHNKRRWSKVNGVVIKMGHWDNWPGGEVYTTPAENQASGFLILPFIDSSVAKKQKADKPVKLTIKDGCVIKIEGKKSAALLKKQLNKDTKKWVAIGGSHLDSFRLAEIGFGANSRAREGGNVSVVEMEKKLGTVHFGVGSSKTGEKESEGFYDGWSHYDFVLPRNGLTVEMFTDEDDFRNKKSGIEIIGEGRFNLL